MRTITFEIYKFDELSPEAQAKAILNNCNINIEDYNWWEPIYEDANEVFLRIDKFNIEYEYIATSIKYSCKQTANKIIRNHGKDTETYKLEEGFLYKLGPLEIEYSLFKTEKSCKDLVRRRLDFYEGLKSYYLRMLQKEYDYLQSDEAVKETLIANEYEFYSDGTPYYERKLK